MLPQELIDEILEYLKDDKATLKACSLAHRMFLPRTRKFLFRTFFVKRLGPDPYTLRSCPEVSKNFREVLIRGNLCSEVKQCSSFVDYRLIDTLRLEGSDMEWKDIHWVLRKPDIPSLPALENLYLSRVYFSSFRQMAATLGSFPKLNNLSLDFEDHVRTFVRPGELDSYSLHLHVRSLHMRLNLITEPGPIPNTLLASSGSHLQHLSLHIVATAPTKPGCKTHSLPCYTMFFANQNPQLK